VTSGLQPERTALAWQRTAVTALVLLMSTVVLGLRVDQPVLAAAGALVTGASAGLLVAVRRRFHDLGQRQPAGSPFVAMVAVAVVVLLGGAGGAVVAVSLWLR
jgi:hypothetical protein